MHFLNVSACCYNEYNLRNDSNVRAYEQIPLRNVNKIQTGSINYSFYNVEYFLSLSS